METLDNVFIWGKKLDDLLALGFTYHGISLMFPTDWSLTQEDERGVKIVIDDLGNIRAKVCSVNSFGEHTPELIWLP